MPAQAPVGSIVELLTELVRIPSRGGIDAYDPVLDAVGAWLSARQQRSQFLTDGDGRRVGLWGAVDGARPGPAYLLNATVDTAPFGDESAWTHAPLAAVEDDGWLYGRGVGDSKAGVAIFCHVLAAAAARPRGWAGRLVWLFDAAEHTGEFTGVRRFMEDAGRATRLAGAYIGYPNMERIAVGGRGFLRARIDVHGVAAHTGSSRRRGVNAIWRAARLVERIQTAELSAPAAPAFPLPPCMSVTTIEGGQGFSVTPDRCELGLDVRLTPHFDAEAAKALVTSFVAELDARDPGVAATQISWIEGWPAYALDGGVAVVRALHEAAAGVLGRDLPIDVVGPSSVGNFFHAHGVPATNGFGVTCENIHGADERIAVASIAPVYETYRRAITALLPG